MRKLWICVWPNGERSIVYADNKDEAILILDEEASATPAMLKPYPDGARFYCTLAPRKETDGACFAFVPDEMSEDMLDEGVFGDADEALHRYKVERPLCGTCKRELGLNMSTGTTEHCPEHGAASIIFEPSASH
jgi:hypothetical protein